MQSLNVLVPSGDVILLLVLALAAAAALWAVISLRNIVQLFFIKGPFMLRPMLREFEQTVSDAEKQLLEMSEREVQKRPAEEKWSGKEILGHLIDSASNNHQRFVRAQLSSEITFPDYEQSGWVRTQDYQNEPWRSLVHFWSSYNRHLMHVVSSISAERLKGLCFVGEDEPVTLEFLIRDYVRHVRHHLRQILAPQEIETLQA